MPRHKFSHTYPLIIDKGAKKYSIGKTVSPVNGIENTAQSQANWIPILHN